jgi:4-amino-4-deoxy-L-arabinose transferase-like glycosyltransferase
MSGQAPSPRFALAATLSLAAATLLWNAGALPLLDPDEARFARTSVEMAASRDPVVPRFEGQPRLVKPPLVHWIQAALFARLGVREWVARLHAALATLGTAWLVAAVARRRYGDEAAPWAVACTVAMPLVFVVGRVGTIDALLALHVTAAVALDLTADGPPRPGRRIALGLILGLAFLAKGPVGVVLPLLLVLAGRTATGRPVVPRPRAALEVAAAFCAAVAPWSLAILRAVGADELVRVVRVEAFERYFAGTTHVEPVWYYAEVVAVGFLPWIAPLLLGYRRMWRLRGDPSSRTARYAGAALVAGLVFFTIGRSKLPTYVLPLAPLAALVVVWELGREIEEAGRRRVGPVLLATTVATLGALLAVAIGVIEPEMRAAAAVGAASCLAGGVGGLLFAWARRPRGTWALAALSMLGFFLAAVTGFFPVLAARHSAADLVFAVSALRDPRPVATVDMKVPSLTFYLDRSIEVVDMADLPARLERPDAPLLVFDRSDLPAVPPAARSRLSEIGGAGKYLVFEKRPEPGLTSSNGRR